MLDLKSQARQIFLQTLKEVDVRLAVSRSIHIQGTVLKAAGGTFDLRDFRELFIVATGKAATPMYEAAIRAICHVPAPGPVVEAIVVEAIVVSPDPPSDQLGQLLFFRGSHPTPDQTSEQAAKAILQLLRRATAQTLVLFLISGGSSAMVELPVAPDLTGSDMAEFHRALVQSGLSIVEMNVLRKHVSAVKGGRLAAAAASSAQCTLVISDVPGGAVDAVGSGPSLPDPSSNEDIKRILQESASTLRLPINFERLLESNTLPETPKQNDRTFHRAVWTSILSSADLTAAAALIGGARGFHVEVDNGCDEWNSSDAAEFLLERSSTIQKRFGRSCLISGGELSVTMTSPSGKGGRNQHFVLQCALVLDKRRDNTVVLSAGSDGIDGNSPAAGAVADGYTCERSIARGIDPSEALDAFDSFRLFDALGDTIIIGPTGNNLRDLRILLT